MSIGMRRILAAFFSLTFLLAMNPASAQDESPRKKSASRKSQSEKTARAKSKTRPSGDNEDRRSSKERAANDERGSDEDRAADSARGPRFELSSKQRAELDRMLRAWEERTSTVKNFHCSFDRWVYEDNSAFATEDEPAVKETHSEGKLKYVAPDKGYFKVSDGGEHWVCTGKSIFEFSYQKKQLIERPLPENIRGQAITYGPLPFVFGAKADDLQARYDMRLITPRDAKGEIWLEAWSRYRQDRASFLKVQIILGEDDMLPTAIQLFDPNGTTRTAYQFHDRVINDPLEWFKGVFEKPRTPLSWKYVLDDPQPPEDEGSASQDSSTERSAESSADSRAKKPAASKKSSKKR